MSSSSQSSYVVLVDQPDDWPDTVWVEADSEDQARDRAAEFCCDEDGNEPFRPVGPAEKVTLQMPRDDEVEVQHPPEGTPVELWRVTVY